MSYEYQNIKKENSETSKIILESFYKYNREKKQKLENLEIKELFNKNKDAKIIEENRLINYKEEKWYQKIFNLIKGLFGGNKKSL